MAEAQWMQALEAGAQTGLGERRLADEELQFGVRQGQEQEARANEMRLATRAAADRLRMAYTSLAAKEQNEAQRESARLQQAQAAMALRAAQFNAVNQLRASELQERQSHNLTMEGTAAQRLAMPQKRNPIHEPGVGIYEYNDQTGQWEQSVSFPEKPSKVTNRPRVKVGSNGAIEAMTGDPNDPAVQQFIKYHSVTQPATQLPGVAAAPSASTPPTAPSPNLLPPGPNGELQLPSGGTSLPAPAISPTPADSKNKQWKLVNGELVPVNSDQNGQ